MSQPRIYQASALSSGLRLELNEAASHHLARVLRAQLGDSVTIFNGQGGEYAANIAAIGKRKVTVDLKEYNNRDAESPLHLCLAQGISRGEKMDYTIQKAVELGVSSIIPLFTERCTVKLDEDRRQKRLEHWQSIIISACEQSGRNFIPEIFPPQDLSRWLPTVTADQYFILAPKGVDKLQQLSIKNDAKVLLLIGPEGGLSEQEEIIAAQKGFLPLNLGPRILRTETAAVAALSALQCYFGDMAK